METNCCCGTCEWCRATWNKVECAGEATIIDIAADLEAKAKETTQRRLSRNPLADYEDFKVICSPEHILALVRWMQELEEAAREYRALFPTSTRGKFAQQDRLDDVLAAHLAEEGKA